MITDLGIKIFDLGIMIKILGHTYSHGPKILIMMSGFTSRSHDFNHGAMIANPGTVINILKP